VNYIELFAHGQDTDFTLMCKTLSVIEENQLYFSVGKTISKRDDKQLIT